MYVNKINIFIQVNVMCECGPIAQNFYEVKRKCERGAEAVFAWSQRFHHSVLLPLRRSMLLRSAASALLRTSEILSVCPVSTVLFLRQSLHHHPESRPFSTSGCLCKKKTSLWLQLAEEGRTMDGNIEEILAPLRLAVKEQVATSDWSYRIFCIRYVLFT